MGVVHTLAGSASVSSAANTAIYAGLKFTGLALTVASDLAKSVRKDLVDAQEKDARVRVVSVSHPALKWAVDIVMDCCVPDVIKLQRSAQPAWSNSYRSTNGLGPDAGVCRNVCFTAYAWLSVFRSCRVVLRSATHGLDY